MILTAAIAGIMAGGALAPSVVQADAKGHCMGANGCKHKSDCSTATNDCKGQNGCKGKGYTELSKAQCNKLATNNPKIKFEAPAAKN